MCGSAEPQVGVSARLWKIAVIGLEKTTLHASDDRSSGPRVREATGSRPGAVLRRPIRSDLELMFLNLIDNFTVTHLQSSSAL